MAANDEEILCKWQSHNLPKTLGYSINPFSTGGCYPDDSKYAGFVIV